MTPARRRSVVTPPSAGRDELTGLLTRAAFSDAVAALPADLPMSIALIDVDDFKRINDELGHAAGDAVLIRPGAHPRR